MNLNYLKSFYITVQNNSISKAAKQLHLTQPGLSLQMQALENEVGTPLLIRSNKGVELTDAGKILYEYTSTLLSLEEKIMGDITMMKEQNDFLKIGSCKAIGEYALPCSLYLFKRQFDQIMLQTTISNSREIIEAVINRTLHMGIVTNRPCDERLIATRITKNPLMFVTAMPLIKTDITIAELYKLPLILREPGSGIREYILTQLSINGADTEHLHPIYEIDSMEAIKTSVIAGKGVAFIPELSIKKELASGDLTAIRIEELILEPEYYMIRHRDHTPSVSQKAFESFLLSNKRGFC